jgi:hypothetical protein
MKSVPGPRIVNRPFNPIEQHHGHARPPASVCQHGPPRIRDGGARRHDNVVAGTSLTAREVSEPLRRDLIDV